jgi:hypothetical protein
VVKEETFLIGSHHILMLLCGKRLAGRSRRV